MSRAKTAAGHALRQAHIRQCVALLGQQELLARALGMLAGWTDGLTEKVLEAAMEDGAVSRRRETPEEAERRAATSRTHRTTMRCWLYRAAEVAPPRDVPARRGLWQRLP